MMTHNLKSTLRKCDQQDIPEDILEKNGSVMSADCSTQRLTLHLSLESKRIVHALAVASNRSIEQVIEELIENCSESTS